MKYAIFPVGGHGIRFKENYCKEPKPFINLFGKTQIEWSILSCMRNYPDTQIVIGCRTGLFQSFLDLALNLKKSWNIDLTILDIGEITKGAAHTVALTLNSLTQQDEDYDFVVSDNDLALELNNVNPFKDSSAGVVTTYSTNPGHSFVICDSKNHVLEIAEKKRISNNGIAGNYYFKSKKEYLSYYNEISEEQSEEYLSSVLRKYLVSEKIVIAEKSELVVSYGTPEEILLLKANSLSFLLD